jgi:hypothetical protein
LDLVALKLVLVVLNLGLVVLILGLVVLNLDLVVLRPDLVVLLLHHDRPVAPGLILPVPSILSPRPLISAPKTRRVSTPSVAFQVFPEISRRSH